MLKNKREKIYTILIGGQAGDGAREAGVNLARLLCKMGYYVFASMEYPSLIRGGHNFCRVSFSKEKIYSDYRELDAIIALNQEIVDIHRNELKKTGVIFFDNNLNSVSGKSGQLISLPISSYAKELNAPTLARTAVALGSLCYYYDLPLEDLNLVFTEIFGTKAQINIDLAKKGFDYLQDKNFDKIKFDKPDKKIKGQIIDGNAATGEGMVAAGMKNYIAYPMTPATSVLHHLAKQASKYDLKVTQAESEVAVINMVLGSAFAGTRTATGTSGGGFALMTEALSMAGIAEIPTVVVESQRPGPSTGVPTRTAQGDLQFARQVLGEFPRIVLAPGDQQEAYELGGKAMNLAWQYQLPVMLMLDKHLSESLSNADLKKIKIKPEKIKMGKGGKNYVRYAFSKDGVSPLCFPGTPDTIVKANSYEHSEDGLISESGEMTVEMFDKRFAKMKNLEKEITKMKGVRIYGDKKSKNVVIFWGSTKGAVLEAIKHTKKSIKAVQVLTLEPLPTKSLIGVLKGAKKIADIELNYTAALASLIREKIGIEIKNKILKYDTYAFEPMELAKKIDKIF
ncbi:MAG TPA: 2-oxoacid:acceptor oxidoreductase subunit alpha [Candidatus Magasanikbacteria bacterium]|nr:2-oxoacid:acceptor oxidoreductase subunit alpha [Candidatus Magasanikbacteria bacterium]